MKNLLVLLLHVAESHPNGRGRRWGVVIHVRMVRGVRRVRCVMGRMVLARNSPRDRKKDEDEGNGKDGHGGRGVKHTRDESTRTSRCFLTQFLTGMRSRSVPFQNCSLILDEACK